MKVRKPSEQCSMKHMKYMGHLAGEKELAEGHNTKKWIAGAIKHPGALHRELGVPEGEKIPSKKLSAAAKKGGKLGKQARLAQTLASFH